MPTTEKKIIDPSKSANINGFFSKAIPRSEDRQQILTTDTTSILREYLLSENHYQNPLNLMGSEVGAA
jgi:hypothetical protein